VIGRALLLVAATATAVTSVASARGTPPPAGAAERPARAPTPRGERQIPSTAPEHRSSESGIASAKQRLSVLDPASPAAEVERWVLRLAENRRSETAAALQRFTIYEPLIRQALHDAQLPQELAYLPLIESAYRPTARSKVGATGLWQFMRRTASSYDLEVSAWVDERRDPVRSTFAAVRHLSDLHDTFGAWHLAAAAYNAGSTRVQRALGRRQAPSDEAFWASRHRLPAETRAYVPMFLAAARIGRTPERFGIDVAPSPPLRFRLVPVPPGTPLATVARAHRVQLSVVNELNPHLIRGSTPPDRTWMVRLPAVPGPAIRLP
jgi:soluble lytic murein transglycosylase-like protein